MSDKDLSFMDEFCGERWYIIEDNHFSPCFLNLVGTVLPFLLCLIIYVTYSARLSRVLLRVSDAFTYIRLTNSHDNLVDETLGMKEYDDVHGQDQISDAGIPGDSSKEKKVADLHEYRKKKLVERLNLSQKRYGIPMNVGVSSTFNEEEQTRSVDPFPSRSSWMPRLCFFSAVINGLSPLMSMLLDSIVDNETYRYDISNYRGLSPAMIVHSVLYFQAWILFAFLLHNRLAIPLPTKFEYNYPLLCFYGLCFILCGMRLQTYILCNHENPPHRRYVVIAEMVHIILNVSAAWMFERKGWEWLKTTTKLCLERSTFGAAVYKRKMHLYHRQLSAVMSAAGFTGTIDAKEVLQTVPLPGTNDKSIEESNLLLKAYIFPNEVEDDEDEDSISPSVVPTDVLLKFLGLPMVVAPATTTPNGAGKVLRPVTSVLDMQKFVLYDAVDSGYSYQRRDDVNHAPVLNTHVDHVRGLAGHTLCDGIDSVREYTGADAQAKSHLKDRLQQLMLLEQLALPPVNLMDICNAIEKRHWRSIARLYSYSTDSDEKHASRCIEDNVAEIDSDEEFATEMKKIHVNSRSIVRRTREGTLADPFPERHSKLQQEYCLPPVLDSPMNTLQWPLECHSSFYQRLTFSWLNPLLSYGYSDRLELKDLDHISPYMTTTRTLLQANHAAEQYIHQHYEDLSKRLGVGACQAHGISTKPYGFGPSNLIQRLDESTYDSKVGKKHDWDSIPGVTLALYDWRFVLHLFWSVTKRKVIQGSLLKLAGDIFGYFPSICLNLLIRHAEDLEDAPFGGRAYGYILGLLLVLTNLLQAQCLQHSYHLLIREGFRARHLSLSLMYQKLLNMSSVAKEAVGAGTVNNLMTTDSGRVESVYWMGYYIIFSPIQVICTIGMQFYYLGWPCFVGVAVLTLALPVQLQMSKTGAKITDVTQAKSDSRVNATLEMLKHIRVVKSQSWESIFSQLVSAARSKESDALRWKQVFNALQAVVLQIAPSLVSTGTFCVYVLVAEKNLTAATAFTALSLFNILQVTLWAMPFTVQYIVEFYIAMKRMAKLFQLPEKNNGVSTPVYQVVSDQNMNATPVNDKLVIAQCRTLSNNETVYLTRKPLFHIPIGEVRFENIDFYVKTFNSGNMVTILRSKQATACESDPQSAALTVECPHTLRLPYPALHINKLTFKTGSLNMIVGGIGSGKTFLLQCIMGEIPSCPSYLPFIKNEKTLNDFKGMPISLPIAHNACVHPLSRIAYVPQTAWIVNGTVRDNIVMDGEFIAEFFAQVIEACALTTDLANMPQGDLTVIAERGNTLSGGQKQRINIARAVYKAHICNIFLFDAPLAALDAHVGAHIYKHVLGPEGMLKHKTRVLVTHQLENVADADQIIVMEGAHHPHDVVRALDTVTVRVHAEMLLNVVKTGTMDEQMVDDSSLFVSDHLITSTAKQAFPKTLSFSEMLDVSLQHKRVTAEATSSKKEQDSQAIAKALQDSHDHPQAPVATTSFEDGVPEEVEEGEKMILTNYDEARSNGRVGWEIYFRYVRSMGRKVSVLSLFLCLLQVAVARATDWWLAQWAGDEQHLAPIQYVKIYAYQQLATVITFFFCNVVCAIGGVRAGISLYNNLLRSVLFTAIQFFDITPLGRLTNRFTSDMNYVDNTLSVAFFNWINFYIQILSFVIMMSLQIVYILPIFIPIFIIFAYVSAYFKNSCRELRLLENVTQSPVYIHLDQTLDGVSCLRTFNLKHVYQNKLHEALDTRNRPRYLGQCLNRWLAMRLDGLGAIILLLIIWMTLALGQVRTYFGNGDGPAGHTHQDASLLGLVIGYALTLTNKLNWLVRSGVDTETQLNSVQRILEFSSLPPEAWNNPYQLEDTCYANMLSNMSMVKESKIVNLIAKEKKKGVFSAPQFVSEPDLDRCRQVVNGTLKWPTMGNISFIDVKARYRSELPLVLRGMNLSQPGGTKIAVVGRTGAGKSSILQILLRIVEHERTKENLHVYEQLFTKNIKDGKEVSIDDNSANVPLLSVNNNSESLASDAALLLKESHAHTKMDARVEIDGIDISKLPLQFLRDHVCVITQEPTLFSHTVRFNLQPYASAEPTTTTTISPLDAGYTQEELCRHPKDGLLWQALVDVNLFSVVAALPGGLDYSLRSSQDLFSLGQKQLLCMARALVKPAKIVMLDECTASVDAQTDNLVQALVHRAFQNRTVITIAHRINTVLDYDSVVVMRMGRVVEVGHPRTLLKTEGSKFRELAMGQKS